MQPEDTPRAAPPVVVVYGPESDNEVLADELALDDFDVRLVSDRALLGAADLIVFAHASKRGAGLDALRALRLGELAGSGARVIWTSPDTVDTLRAFEAGADDVIRTPLVYPELLACSPEHAHCYAATALLRPAPLWEPSDTAHLKSTRRPEP